METVLDRLWDGLSGKAGRPALPGYKAASPTRDPLVLKEAEAMARFLSMKS